MSAFLAYSNSRRAALKRQNPKATNADLSRMLSKTWKELPATERAVYLAEERKLRDKYQEDMKEWRKKVAEEKTKEREERVAAAFNAPRGPQVRTQDAESKAQQNKWFQTMQQQQQMQVQMQQDELQQMQVQEPQMSDMSTANMFSNPYLQAAAFGGAGVGQGGLGFNPSSANPYLASALGNQGFGMQSASGGNPAISQWFGKCTLRGQRAI